MTNKQDLTKAFKAIQVGIQEYESDTFDGTDICLNDIEEMALELIVTRILKAFGSDIDGDELEAIHYEIRKYGKVDSNQYINIVKGDQK